jgi:large subunit ribosomal protein L25
MATDRATLKVSERTGFGSRESRRLRRSGYVPGVLYAGGSEARPFKVGEREVRALLGEAQALFDLEIEGSRPVPAVVKEEQRHPVRGDLLHLDCMEVKLDVEIEAEVTVELEGTEEAPGVMEGGVLEHVTREVTIEALPAEIPERLVADVSAMSIGDTLQLSAIEVPAGVKLIAEEPDEVTIATLTPPRLEEEPEPEVEEEAELIGEEAEQVPEGEEAPVAEGEAPAEAEGGEEGSSGEGE